MLCKIILESKLDFTDANLIEILKEDFSSGGEYCEVTKDLVVFNKHAEEVVRFFADFDGGRWCPEKCDIYEPIREIFDKEAIALPVKWLSNPGSSLFLMKKKTIRYTVLIENLRFAPIWEVGVGRLRSHTKLPDYLSSITVIIDKRQIEKLGPAYFKLFVSSLKAIAKAEKVSFYEVREAGEVLLNYEGVE